MSKRRKASIIVTGRKRFFGGVSGRKCILVSASTTGSATGTQKGVIYCQVGTTGATTGSVYIAVDTSGTGTKLNA